MDMLPRQIAVQVHLPEPDSMRAAVAVINGRHTAYFTHIRYRRQSAYGDVNGAGEIRGIHHFRNIQRAEVAADITAGVAVAQVVVVFTGAVDLEDL